MDGRVDRNHLLRRFDFGLPVLLAADHEIAATLVEKYLYQCVRVLWAECETVASMMAENAA